MTVLLLHIRRQIPPFQAKSALLLLILLLWGCGPAPHLATTTPKPIAQISSTPTPSPTPTKTPRPTKTATKRPTRTPSPTPTKTPRPTKTATPTPHPFDDYAHPSADAPTPPFPYPSPVPLLGHPAHILNIALLGNDGNNPTGHRTDTMIIASINTTAQTATLLSLPRDLFVYMPGWQMDRLNLAFGHGGFPLFQETVRYNFGLELDHYVRVGFEGFRQAVDALGGVTVAVTCPLEDWRLKSADLDPTVEENYTRHKLQPNVYKMDGSLALWYARSRITTSDFARSRRQQQIITALLTKALSENRLSNVATLYNAFSGQYDTDLSLAKMGQMATWASNIRNNGLRYLAIDSRATQSLTFDNRFLLQLDWESAEPILHALQSSPTLGRASRSPLTVEVVATNWTDYRLAAENLEWQGFITQFTQSWNPVPAQTTIHYHRDNLKGSFDGLISWVFFGTPVQLAPNPNAKTDYRITLGQNFNPCR